MYFEGPGTRPKKGRSAQRNYRWSRPNSDCPLATPQSAGRAKGSDALQPLSQIFSALAWALQGGRRTFVF